MRHDGHVSEVSDQPITREHLSVELGVIRQEVAELRTEMHPELRLMFAALVAVMGVLCGIATTVVTVRG